MVEHLIKTINHGIIMLSATLENMDCWHEQVAKVKFGYICKIQANTKFSPFMIMIGRTPHLRASNYLHSSIALIDDIVDTKFIIKQFFQELKLIVSIHENVMLNVEQAQKKQKKTYLLKKGCKPLKDGC
jgi:hypothetical protein